MEYISTTTLAHEFDVPVNEMFSKLKSMGFIDRRDNRWILTDQGKQKGGKIKNDPKFGEYIVWPENISFNEDQKNGSGLLNSTTLGKHFNVSNQRMNLILSELGLIESDVTGWRITKLGRNLGGKQLQHDQSGKFFVLWPQGILTNRNLLDVFMLNQNVKQKEEETVKAESNSIANFRHKYPANYRTQDGHFVRSKSEKIIDDWLYQSGIVHSYERKLPIEEDVVSDFYIPSGNGRPQAVYIEFWGLEDDPKYKDRMKAKIEIYKRNELALIELVEADIQNIDDIFPKKLLQFKIKVG